MDTNHKDLQTSEQSETKYAQLVSSIVSNYDVTLIFHQLNAIQKNSENLTDFDLKTKETARIVIPMKSAMELKDLLNKQLEPLITPIEKNSAKKALPAKKK